ncbi:CUE domain-containing protein, partial [Cephalotus follicularis]
WSQKGRKYLITQHTCICGKRVGFEEIFGSSPSSSAKRSRCSSFGSPTRSPGSGSEDPVSGLFQVFPSLDPELVRSVLRNHNNKIEDAMESLRALSFSDAIGSIKSQSVDSVTIGNSAEITNQDVGTCSQMSEQKVEDIKDRNSTFEYDSNMDGSQWVDLFVHEMMNATNVDDARGRAVRILEAFEKSVTTNLRASEELEHASLKEHLQSLFNDNQILKRAVAIQHERNLEQEEKGKEVQQLKLVLSQYQQQVRNLEVSNYALKLHLQRAGASNSISGQFHPDIY